MKPANSIVGQSALQAFRSDLPLGGATADADDEAAILVATLLRQQLSIPETDAARPKIVAHAISVATESLGGEALAEGCTYDEHPSRSDIDIGRRLVQRTEHKGWLRLSQHLLESLSSMAREPIDQGRVLADRVRNSRKQGQLDLSAAQAEELGRLAQRIKSDELLGQFHSANAALAQIRGNLVDFRKHVETLLKLAKRAGLRRFIAAAHAGVGTVDSRMGNYSDAVAHLWTAYRTVEGKGVIAGEALGNLAQTLAISGRPDEGRKMASLYLSTTSRIQSVLPALGTYTLCSARLNDVDAVIWGCERIRTLAKARHFPREVAEALIESAISLDIVGQPLQAGVMRRRAEALATTFGFHDLTFTESLVASHGQPPERPPFRGVGAKAEREIAELSVPRIPDVELVGL